MKKNTLMLYLLCSFALQTYSQKWYVSLSGAYGLSTAPNSNFASTNSTRSPGTNSISNSKGSYGKGFQFGAIVG